MLHSSPSPEYVIETTEKRYFKDDSESGKEFGWVCGWLRAGRDPEEAMRRLSAKASERGKKDHEKYAKRSIEKAIREVLIG